MTGGAVHQVGSHGVTVPNLMHPRPTVKMGWDKRGVLPLIQSRQIQANIFLGPKQGVPAMEHLCDHLAELADISGTLPASMQVKVVRMCTSW
jgi:hypothetical protein